MNLTRAVALGLLGLLIWSRPVSAATPTIRWEVENGFRYFKRASDFREMAKAYDEEKANNPKPSVLQLEKAIENKVINANQKFNDISGADRRLGWAASIYLDTCGRQADHTHSSCEMENNESYLEPKTTNIILYIDGITSGTCEWSIDGVALKKTNCNRKDDPPDVKTKPLVARMTYNDTHRIEVKPTVGDTVTANIMIKDILIVSFGDSFSAGEGNPEQPATFSNVFSDYNRSSRYGFPAKTDVFPVREPLNQPGPEFFGDKAANWTNSQCHRSLYSQHARAALHYALEHPHVSVTFMNYSCTGAEVYEGILNAWWGRDVSEARWDDAPQLVKALRDLCKDPEKYSKTEWSNGDRQDNHFNSGMADIPKCDSFGDRKVDALLLSIGGNDVGFANMIANSAIDVPKAGPLKAGRPWAYGLWRAASGPQTFDQGKVKAKAVLPGRYKELDSQLKTYLMLRSDQVVLSAYPDVSADESGKICAKRNLGMDVHAVFGMNNPTASSQSANFVRYLHGIMKTQSEKLGWRFSNQHIAKDGAPNNFTNDDQGHGHGICAAGPADRIKAAMQFPRPPLPQPEPFVWKPFYPEAWTPYSERNRWLVTPNDSFLTTNYLDRNLALDDPVQPLYAATLSGSFHPNALGHAALADSVLVELRKVLVAYEDK
jgi:hypothetical protein